MEFYTTVDDELYEELGELVGQKVVYFELWEDSLADELEADGESSEVSEEDTSFDLDLYLDDGIYFQLYSAAFFPNLESEPWQGQENVHKALRELMKNELVLSEVAVDEDDGLVLVFSQKNKPVLYCSVGGWLLEEWDELPE